MPFSCLRPTNQLNFHPSQIDDPVSERTIIIVNDLFRIVTSECSKIIRENRNEV